MTEEVHKLETARLRAGFGREGQLFSLENRSTNEILPIEDGAEFRILADDRGICAKDCDIASVRVFARDVNVAYTQSDFVVDVRYHLGKEDHFLLKSIEIHHRNGYPFSVSSCTTHSWNLNAEDGRLVPFAHGQCVTYFLRMKQGGIFFRSAKSLRESTIPERQVRRSHLSGKHEIRGRKLICPGKDLLGNVQTIWAVYTGDATTCRGVSPRYIGRRGWNAFHQRIPTIKYSS